MINLKNRYNLWKLKQAASPSANFKASLRKDLNMAWDARYGKTSWYQVGMTHLVSGFTVIALLLTGGGGVYAYSNPEVTEGTTLYPLKQAIETVEEVTKITPEARAKFYIKKIERREAERKVLKKKELLPEVEREVEKVEPEIKQDIKVEAREEVEVRAVEKKLQRTEKSIERAEEQLEKTRQIMEKTESKNVKLREELKKRSEERAEKIKKQLEIRNEKQKERQEKLREAREARNNLTPEIRGQRDIKTDN